MTARKERGRTRGRPFAPGNAGRPKGAKDRRTVVGIEVAAALAGQAWDEVEKLLGDDSARVRLEASRLVLEYALGKPKQALSLSAEDVPLLVTVEHRVVRMSEASAEPENEEPAAPAPALPAAPKPWRMSL